MAEDEVGEIRINAETTAAEKSLDRLIDRMAGLNQATGHSDKGLQSLERQAVKLQSTVGNLAGNYRKGQASIAELRQEVQRLQTSLGAVEKSFRLPERGMTDFGKNARATKIQIQEATKAMADWNRVANSQVQNRNLKNQGMLFGQEGVERRLGQQYDRGAALNGTGGNIPHSRIGQFYQGQTQAAKQFNAEIDQTRMKSGQMFQQFQQGSRRSADSFQTFFSAQRQATQEQVRVNQEAARMESAYDGLANTRYALFDVARALTIVSTATLGVSIAAIKTEADFENLLVQVKRTSDTSGAEFDALRTSLIQMTTEIPASIEDVTTIATLAGQLGIASESIDEFTESVLMFSATTDVSAEAAAEKIGRVAQLAGVGADEYHDLAASIYQVGITSVSTESAILSITEQIAVSARQAGFAAEETVALSSALASLSVAPERARGSIQRVFNIITNAVDNGSEEMQTFARLTGMTASEFGRVWKEDAQAGFLAFVDGLGRAGDAGENMNNILKDVGIEAVRDSDALKRLAQNTEVYSQAIYEAAEGWRDGSSFAEGYADVADTLNNRLMMLWNTIKAIIEAAQDNSALKGFVGLLQGLADIALKIAQSPIGQILAGASLAVGALVGTLALAGAGAATFAASLFAVITALRFMTRGMQEGVGITKLATNALVEYIAAARGMSVAQVQATVSTKGLSGAMTLLGASSRGANVAVKSLKYTLVSTGWGIALVALGTAAAAVWAAFEDGNEVIDKMKADLGGLGEAVKADTATWEESGVAIGTHTRKLEEDAVEIDNAAATTETWVGVQEDSKEATEDNTEAVKEQTIAFGENADAAIRSALANNEAIQKIATDPAQRSILEKTGFDWNEAILAGMTGDVQGSAGIKEYTDSIVEGLRNNMSPGEFNEILPVLQTVFQALDAIGDELDSQMALGSAMSMIGEGALSAAEDFEETGEAAKTATEEMQEYVDQIFVTIDAMSGMYGATDALGASLAENGNDFSTYTEAGRNNLNALKDAFSTAVVASEGDADMLGQYVEGIIQGMENSGVAGVRNLQIVQEMLALTAQQAAQAQAMIAGVRPGQANQNFFKPGMADAGAGVRKAPVVTETKRGMSQVNSLANQIENSFGKAKEEANQTAGAARGAGRAAREARQEVRTLSDYVSDLKSVFSDSFEFRFGFQQAEDSSRKAFRSIREAMDDAEKSVRDLRLSIKELHATLSGLSSDRTILQYQLKIAREYNDEIREQAILAELEKNAADTAKTREDLRDETKDLGKEEEFLKKSLTSNTEAGGEHRAMVLDLVSAYQDQLTAYANTGASQKEVERYARQLKQQFQQEAQQLGYNEQEIRQYTRAFDDMILVIQEMPRNLTLSVSANPALRALDEFNSRARSANTSVDNLRNNLARGVGSLNTSDWGDKKFARRLKYMADIAFMERKIREMRQSGQPSYAMSAIRNEIVRLSNMLNSGSYRSGGYTGNGGVNDIAGAVHGKEFVFDAPSTKAIGPGNLYAMMEAAKKGGAGMQSGGYAGVMPSISVGSSANGVVSLSAGTIQQLARVMKTDLLLDGSVVGQASSKSFARSTRVGAN